MPAWDKRLHITFPPDFRSFAPARDRAQEAVVSRYPARITREDAGLHAFSNVFGEEVLADATQLDDRRCQESCTARCTASRSWVRQALLRVTSAGEQIAPKSC